MINMLSHLFVGLMLCFLCFVSALTFIFNTKHLLSVLLSLELMMVSLFCYFILVLGFQMDNICYSLVLLTLAACEAAVGLSVLVNMISSHGSSHVNSLNLQQC